MEMYGRREYVLCAPKGHPSKTLYLTHFNHVNVLLLHDPFNKEEICDLLAKI